VTPGQTLNKSVKKIHVIQGEHHVSGDPDVVLTTILGSCIAVCMRDTRTGFGGMNHFLLPDGKADPNGEGRRYGAYAMELLINEILRSGGRRDRMEAKLFGGARMLGGLSDIGAANAAFAEKFLRDEGIPIVGGSLGGLEARRIQYWPSTGRAQQRTVTDTQEVATLREAPVKAPPPSDDGDLELF
jgi:chemotaxis protein CheD